jgi:hypothetical protein
MRHKRSSWLVAVAVLVLAGLGVFGASAARPAGTDASEVTHWNQVALTTLAAFPGQRRRPAFNKPGGAGAVRPANAIGPKQHRPYLLNNALRKASIALSQRRYRRALELSRPHRRGAITNRAAP